MKRKLLARGSGIATRQRVYQIADGLEVDDIDHYEVRRSRVLFEDVILMTHHRARGKVFLIVTGVLAFLFATLSWAVGRNQALAGWIFFAMSGGPIVLLFLLRLVLGVDEINVYSRRSSARMRFWFRKGRGRQLFDEISRTVRRRQNAMLRSVAAVPELRDPDPTAG
ncbi:MAG TPA: hypothetical protein VMS98_00205 [Thermoanaerobaculia bacterium]|nr:hypothetical protein [Thermoanaerobaculia bacterium]